VDITARRLLADMADVTDAVIAELGVLVVPATALDTATSYPDVTADAGLPDLAAASTPASSLTASSVGP
jgi:hypothetical protein